MSYKSYVFQVSVYSVPEKKEHTSYALDTATKLLKFYNNFFEMNYPLRKLGEHTKTQIVYLSLMSSFFQTVFLLSYLPSLICKTW